MCWLLQGFCVVTVVYGCFAKPQSGDAGFNLNPTSGNTTPTDCACVPFYLCRNDTIVTDGRGVIDIRKLPGVCDNYMKICCKLENQVTEPITPVKPPVDRPQGCGYRNSNGLGFSITGATDGQAQFAEFPWVVALLTEEHNPDTNKREQVYQCGGSLIHPRIVLTAAHCVTGSKIGKKITVRAGEWDTQHTNEPLPFQERDVETISVHKEYRPGVLYNDFALLVLKEPVTITGNVDVVCLPPKGTISDSNECFSGGWGKKEFGKAGNYQVIMKKVDLPVVANLPCQESLQKTNLGPDFELHRSFMCAGGVAGKDTCRGDGGSPLVCPIPGQAGRYYQMGIVAWGINCGRGGVPGVYANVAAVRDWIDEEMQYQRVDAKSYTH